MPSSAARWRRPPVLSHENRQERFFTFPLETQRLSGTIDRVNVVVRERLLAEMPLEESAKAVRDRRCALVQQPPRAGREAGHHSVRARHLAQRRTV